MSERRMKDQTPSETLYVANRYEAKGDYLDGKIINYIEATPAEIIAALRERVESGSIEGEVEWWECFEWDHNPHHICDHGPPCGFHIVIPISDGGSET